MAVKKVSVKHEGETYVCTLDDKTYIYQLTKGGKVLDQGRLSERWLEMDPKRFLGLVRMYYDLKERKNM